MKFKVGLNIEHLQVNECRFIEPQSKTEQRIGYVHDVNTSIPVLSKHGPSIYGVIMSLSKQDQRLDGVKAQEPVKITMRRDGQ
jgi:hypothetical protein